MYRRLCVCIHVAVVCVCVYRCLMVQYYGDYLDKQKLFSLKLFMTNIKFHYTLVFIRLSERKNIFVRGCKFFDLGEIWGELTT
jgi:hypothetical protein